MVQRCGGLFLLALLAACGREDVLSGPAPAGALQCAIDHGRQAGYEVSDGSVERGFVRLSERLPPPPVPPAPTRPRPVDLADVVLDRADERAVENQILAVYQDGRLELTVVGFDGSGGGVAPGGTVQDDARTILSLCTDDPAAPAGAGGGEPAQAAI